MQTERRTEHYSSTVDTIMMNEYKLQTTTNCTYYSYFFNIDDSCIYIYIYIYIYLDFKNAYS
jgi:Zn-finger protein